jgi:signal transduction histidine kinase/ActR/RegA family two-component response regulator
VRLLARLGLDAAYDLTIERTRQRTMTRLVLATPLGLVVCPILGPRETAFWAASMLVGELCLWLSTDPVRYARRRGAGRMMRLLASSATSFTWLMLAGLLWREGSEAAHLMGMGVLAGGALYVQRTWDDTPIQVIASASPLGAGLLAAPFLEQADLVHRAGLAISNLLFVGFVITSVIAGYRRARKLAEANSALVREREAAEAANRAKTEFLANMSHEIRTPLNGVIGAVDVLRASPLAPREREMVEMVRASGETLERLLSDVLDLARVEAGRITVEAADFDLGAAVRSAAALMEVRAQDKGLAFVVDIAPEAEVAVRGDGVRLKQIVTNLVSNAVKFTQAGEVRTTARRTGEMTVVTVEDTGVGFDPADKDRLFGRFQQADGSITRRFGGSGLGLAISRQLAELMGGALDAESTPGRGSRFVLTLPLPDALDGAPVAAPESVEELADSGDLRILLADDHPTNRKVVELMLDRPGVRLVAAADGREAFDAFRAEPFDLVLMDMQMPVMDGLSTTRALRAHEATQGRDRTPVIMLTANALPEHVASAQAAGADHHLAKPITAAALFKAIGEVLAQRDSLLPLSEKAARSAG